MSPIRTSQCNFTYTAPAGMTAEQCGELPCLRDKDIPVVISWWQPTPEERAHIAAGGHIVLQTHGRSHPPVALSTCLPEPIIHPAPVDAGAIARQIQADRAARH